MLIRGTLDKRWSLRQQKETFMTFAETSLIFFPEKLSWGPMESKGTL